MIDIQETRRIVIKIIAEKLKRAPELITDDATLQGLGADSLDIVEIIMNLEESLMIHINDEEAERLRTIKDVIEYVHGLCQQK